MTNVKGLLYLTIINRCRQNKKLINDDKTDLMINIFKNMLK